jgi:hypothetical protein
MNADTNDTLFERPNVRVRVVPASMCPARESRLWRDAKHRGALFWGYHFFGHAKKGYEKHFSFYGAHGTPYILDAASGAA